MSCCSLTHLLLCEWAADVTGWVSVVSAVSCLLDRFLLRSAAVSLLPSPGIPPHHHQCQTLAEVTCSPLYPQLVAVAAAAGVSTSRAPSSPASCSPYRRSTAAIPLFSHPPVSPTGPPLPSGSTRHPTPRVIAKKKKKNSESALSRCRRAPFCLFYPRTERRWSAADSRHLVSACAAAVHASAALQPNSQTQLQMCSPATFSLFCPNLFLCPIANSALASSQCFSLRQRSSVKQISPLRTHLQLLGVYRQFAEAADMIRHQTAFAGQIEGETFGWDVFNQNQRTWTEKKRNSVTHWYQISLLWSVKRIP